MNMKITISQLRKIIREEVERNLTEAKFKVGDKVEETGTDKESKGFDDYVRDVDRDMPTSWDSPDPQDVHDEFLMWRDRNGEVPLEKLASELGVNPKNIDWNGTGLRVINGVVTELL